MSFDEQPYDPKDHALHDAAEEIKSLRAALAAEKERADKAYLIAQDADASQKFAIIKVREATEILNSVLKRAEAAEERARKAEAEVERSHKEFRDTGLMLANANADIAVLTEKLKAAEAKILDSDALAFRDVMGSLGRLIVEDVNLCNDEDDPSSPVCPKCHRNPHDCSWCRTAPQSQEAKPCDECHGEMVVPSGSNGMDSCPTCCPPAPQGQEKKPCSTCAMPGVPHQPGCRYAPAPQGREAKLSRALATAKAALSDALPKLECFDSQSGIVVMGSSMTIKKVRSALLEIEKEIGDDIGAETCQSTSGKICSFCGKPGAEGKKDGGSK